LRPREQLTAASSRRARALVSSNEYKVESSEKLSPGPASADETFDIGMDTGSPVRDDYKSPNPYTGTLKKY